MPFQTTGTVAERKGVEWAISELYNSARGEEDDDDGRDQVRKQGPLPPHLGSCTCTLITKSDPHVNHQCYQPVLSGLV